MEVAGIKAQRQTWSEADVYKLKNAVKRAQGTDDAGVNWASVSMELGRCIAHVKKKWRRIKLDNGKAGDGYRQAQFSQPMRAYIFRRWGVRGVSCHLSEKRSGRTATNAGSKRGH